MKKAIIALIATLTLTTPVASARYYLHNTWHSGFSNNWFNNWYSRFPTRFPSSTNETSQKDSDIIDLDDYINKGIVITKSNNSQGNNGINNKSLNDMKKKQEDMQKEMDKQRKEMEESFANISKPKGESKLETLPQKMELPQQELPKTELQQQTLQPLPELPKLEQSKLPDVPTLQQLPSLGDMQTNQSNNEQRTVTQTDPNKAPAKINIDEQKPARVITDDKKEEGGIHLSNKTLIIMVLVFLGVGVLFVLSK